MIVYQRGQEAQRVAAFARAHGLSHRLKENVDKSQ